MTKRRHRVHAYRTTGLLFNALGYACLVLAIVGALLPLLPSTPFVLLAAWAFARTNPVMLRRLRQHHVLGPPLRDWQAGRGISLKSKLVATAFIGLAFAISIGFFVEPLVAKGLLGALAASLVIYLLSRPTSRR